jgi:hypothetical protein
MKKSEMNSHSVVCWGSACEGNFHAPGWPPANQSSYRRLNAPVDVSKSFTASSGTVPRRMQICRGV